MNSIQYYQLLHYIMENHSWYNGIKGRCIKYIRPHFDTRTSQYYGITLDTLEGRENFFAINENQHRNLYEWIMEWLNNKGIYQDALEIDCGACKGRNGDHSCGDFTE
jgi:hypothetical protein